MRTSRDNYLWTLSFDVVSKKRNADATGTWLLTCVMNFILAFHLSMLLKSNANKLENITNLITSRDI